MSKPKRAVTEVQDLEERVEKMAPHERLRLAAELLAEERVSTTLLAHAIAVRVVTELGAAIALARLRGEIR